MSSQNSPIDTAVSALVDRASPANLDDLLDSDPDEAFFSSYRAQRMQQLSRELSKAKSSQRTLETLRKEEDVLAITTGGAHDSVVVAHTASSSEPAFGRKDDEVEHDDGSGAIRDHDKRNRVIVHFFHPDFSRCKTMDSHLEFLASLHYEVRFCRISVLECPFLVEKLKIRVLPCVIGFVDGLAKERVVGFEGLGGSGTSFETASLEKRLVSGGILMRRKVEEGEGVGQNHTQNAKAIESDSEDDDWD